jgi:hypothetical protein
MRDAGLRFLGVVVLGAGLALLWSCDGHGEDEYEGDDRGECDDGADNDRDTLFDCDDGGCAGSPACEGGDGDVDGDTDDVPGDRVIVRAGTFTMGTPADDAPMRSMAAIILPGLDRNVVRFQNSSWCIGQRCSRSRRGSRARHQPEGHS